MLSGGHPDQIVTHSPEVRHLARLARAAVARVGRDDRHLHMWTQIVGKLEWRPRLRRAMVANPALPDVSWARTSAIPYGERLFEMDFDFIDHWWW